MAPVLLRPLLPLLLLVIAATAAQQQQQQQQKRLRIYDASTEYAYHGCFNETTGVAGSDRSRALAGGIDDVRPGAMTVPLCLGFCADGRTRYRYAGLEWSRECWCAQSLAGISARLDDARCDLPCEGDPETSCGGSLKLAVYRLTGASTGLRAPAFAASLGLAAAIVS